MALFILSIVIKNYLTNVISFVFEVNVIIVVVEGV